MNFLAHLYLSGASNPIKIGNFIGDYVKGKKYLNYPSEIQKGILLHRSIDFYTDCHPLVAQSSNRLREKYNRYSGVIVDILYDHFLAKNWEQYHHLSLSRYTNHIHEILLKNYLVLPLRVKQFLPFLIQSRRLESYANIEGIRRALDIMSRRTSLPAHTNFAIDCLERYYSEFEQEFTHFFMELTIHVQKEHNITVEAPNDSHPTAGR